MKIEVAKHERMSETGSSLMRLIQNNELPLLDLLVREAIQNSSDAKKKFVDKINVKFNTGNFDVSKFSSNFEGIEKQLNRRFPGIQDYLEIRDSNTTGLTGALHHSEVDGNDFGNLINLIYEISKPQQREGSGGSWGLGKTIYFRVGIGLVLYYTRIKIGSEYKSRLAACLVEDENKDDAILPKLHEGPKRGIAWWGEDVNNNYTVPLTDENEIEEILGDIGVTPYVGDETGTSIIIPFVDREKLLKSAHATYKKEKINYLPWLNTLEDYLIGSIQKWYAPRINNPGYKIDCMLNPSVNDHIISPRNMYPLYQTQIDLYNNSSYAKNGPINLIVPNNTIEKHKVSLRGTFMVENEAGEIVYAILERSDLKMSPPFNYKDPYTQLNIENYSYEGENAPILSYCRKPGMIINYDCNGVWTSKIIKPSEDKYLIGLFIPNSFNELNNSYNNILLEEYLRKSEKADHRSWGDWTVRERNPMIVSKIIDNIARKVNSNLVNNITEKYEVKKTSIGKNLASILLPPEDFGKKPTISKSNKTKSKNSKIRKHSRKSAINITDMHIDNDDNKIMKFEVTIPSRSIGTLIDLRVESENGNIQANKWEDPEGIGLPFPYAIDDIVIMSLDNQDDKKQYTELHDIENIIDLSFSKTELFSKNYGFTIYKKLNNNILIKGEIRFNIDKDDFAAVIHAKDLEGDLNA